MKRLCSLLSCAALSAGSLTFAITGSPFLAEPGEGTSSEWVRNSMSVIDFPGFLNMVSPDYGGAIQMVTGEDGRIWIDYPISSFLTTGWAEGRIAGDELTFTLPQEIYQEDGKSFYLAIVNKDADGSYWMDTDQVLRFHKSGDSWISALGTESRILGLVNSDGIFSNAGDFDLELAPFKAPEPVDDSGVEYSRYAFVAGQNGHFVEIGFRDDEVFISGLLAEDTDRVIKGNREGDTVSFPSGAYLGISSANSSTPHYNYMVAVSEDSEGEYVAEESLEFEYDEQTGRFSSEGTYILNHSDDLEMLNYWEYFEHPEMFRQSGDQKLVPANPTSVIYGPGSDSVVTNIPQVATNGDLLDADLLYYQLYIDGELFYFYQDEYKYLDMEWMSQVPYNYTEEYDFVVHGTYHEIYIYAIGAQVIGIQSIYEGPEGTTYSDIVNSDGTVISVPNSAVKAVEATGNERVEYYDMLGRRVSDDSRGLLLRRAGSRTEKIIR